MNNNIKNRLNEYVSSAGKMAITVIPKQLNNIALGPCIWIGPTQPDKLLFFHKEDINGSILTKIYKKAINDNNITAAIDLLTYAAYNNVEFWHKYEKTELGTLTMAKILGQK